MPKRAQRDGELVVGAAVEVAPTTTMWSPDSSRVVIAITWAARPLRRGERADAALEARHALLEHRGGRVHDPRVDVAEAVEVEEVGRVLGVLEDVGRRLVDRHGPRAGDRVDALAGVERAGVEAEVAAPRRSRDERRPSRREPTTPVDEPDHVEPAEEAAVLHLDAAVLDHLEAGVARARRPTPARQMPSCIQTTFAPSAMASSTTGGMSSGRRKTSTISSGTEGGGLLERGHAGTPHHLVAGRVHRDDLVAVGGHVDHGAVARPVGARRQAHHRQPAVAIEDAAHGVRGRAVGHAGVLGHGPSMPVARRSQVVHHSVTGKSPALRRAWVTVAAAHGPVLGRDPPFTERSTTRWHVDAESPWRSPRRHWPLERSWPPAAAATTTPPREPPPPPPGPTSPATSRSTAPPPSGPSPRPPPRPSTPRTPGVNITVGTSGTGGGFELFCKGETDISDASREIKPEEVTACKSGGVDLRGAARGLGRHHDGHGQAVERRRRRQPHDRSAEGDLGPRLDDQQLEGHPPGGHLQRRAAHAGGPRLAVGHLRLLQREGHRHGRGR